MADLDMTVWLAKSGQLSRAQTYSAICAMAEQRREPGESEHQSFAKYVSGEGAELFRLCQKMPGRDIEPVWQAPVSKAQPTAGDTHTPSSDWDGLVNGLMRSQKISRNKAITAALSSEEGRAVFREQKRREQVGSDMFSKADMAMLDAIDEEQQEHEDVRKRANQHMSEFEHKVRDLRQAKPHLTEMQVQDHVRSTPDGMEAWLKHKGKPGRNGLPQDEGEASQTYSPPSATSGRDGQSGAQWTSDHSGSTPVTPARAPERFSEVSSVKRWNDLKKRYMRDYGFSEDRAVDILKLMPEGKRAIAAVIQAAEAAAAQS